MLSFITYLGVLSQQKKNNQDTSPEHKNTQQMSHKWQMFSSATVFWGTLLYKQCAWLGYRALRLIVYGRNTVAQNVLYLLVPSLTPEYKFLTTFDGRQKSERKYRAPKGDKGNLKPGLQ